LAELLFMGDSAGRPLRIGHLPLNH
jgi:hypothetical protein